MVWVLIVAGLLIVIDHVSRILVRHWYTYVWWHEKPGYKKCGVRLQVASRPLGGIASIVLEAVDPIDIDDQYNGRW